MYLSICTYSYMYIYKILIMFVGPSEKDLKVVLKNLAHHRHKITLSPLSSPSPQPVHTLKMIVWNII